MKKISRRLFLGNGAFLSLAGFFGLLPAAAIARQHKPKSKFVHHVYFWLHNPDSAEDKAKLIEGLRTLTNLKPIRLAHIGEPASTTRDVIERGYAVSWLLFFDNLKDQEVYQKHPVHVKFVENYSHLWSKVIVYDSVDV